MIHKLENGIGLIKRKMNKLEIIKIIQDLWNKYKNVEYHYYTTHEIRVIEEFLDDIEREEEDKES